MSVRGSTASPVRGSSRRFIDPKPEFLFVPARQVLEVAKRESAIPYDVPNVELGHHGPQCSFDAFIDRYELSGSGAGEARPIVRGADTDDRGLTPESAGLYAAATGFQAISRDDFDNMARQFPLYDALYAFCRAAGLRGPAAVAGALRLSPRRRQERHRGRALPPAGGGPRARDRRGGRGHGAGRELAPGAVKGLAGDGLRAAPAGRARSRSTTWIAPSAS